MLASETCFQETDHHGIIVCVWGGLFPGDDQPLLEELSDSKEKDSTLPEIGFVPSHPEPCTCGPRKGWEGGKASRRKHPLVWWRGVGHTSCRGEAAMGYGEEASGAAGQSRDLFGFGCYLEDSTTLPLCLDRLSQREHAFVTTGPPRNTPSQIP